MNEGMDLKGSAVLHKPELVSWEREGSYFFLDPDSPNWISSDQRGSQVLKSVDGKQSINEIVRSYSQINRLEFGKAWLDVTTFLRDSLRSGMISSTPFLKGIYPGRDHFLKLQRLKEFWIHLTQTCNLSCSHCLVSSGPGEERGAETNLYLDAINEACELGVERFYFTGGEPFAREDVFELVGHVTVSRAKEMIILTNATLFTPQRLEKLNEFSREKLKFQVSMDGVTAETNDKIRGKGVFEKASRGLQDLSRLGFQCSLTSVVNKSNLKELEDLPRLAKKLGAKSVHLMWLHKRGRALEGSWGDFKNQFVPVHELLSLCRKVKNSSEKLGILFDNLESLKLRVNGQPGVKYDLGNQCWESLCLYMDGQVYPSAATAGHTEISLGKLNGQGLKSLWMDSPLANVLRSGSVVKSSQTGSHPFRYLTGGGDSEHSFFHSSNGSKGDWAAQDPYHELYVELMKDVMFDLTRSKRESLNIKTGFQSPVILHAMGEGAIACSEDAQSWLEGDGLPQVRLLRSNCVLSFDVEKPYRAIQKFYGAAAEKPQKELCCPIKYDDREISHIPQEVIERFYGCGSPISLAQAKKDETVLDLGSGAGIDCFIASKKVGPGGKVIGIDMTDQMLEVARSSNAKVAQNLGYGNVEFKKGLLEKIPVHDSSVSLVTSNCVINLSPDKRKVFSEIWRILKDTGRFVIADIVSDRRVPLSLQAHQDLWGECISGSLSEDEFLSILEKSGFYGIEVLKKTSWKEVQGVRFYSLTVRGFKYEKKKGCNFIGQSAVYLGPYKAVMDEEGHLFPRGEAIEVCTDTVSKLKSGPYSSHFSVLEPGKHVIPIAAGSESFSGSEQDCGPSCCC